MRSLGRVLSGREARARLQEHILRSAAAVVQVSLNIPGFPKEMDGSRRLAEAVGEMLTGSIRRCGGRVGTSWLLENGMGPAFLFGAEDVVPEDVKRHAISLEEKPGGSALDIDVILPCGTLSRTSLGYSPRRCFLCRRPAKECARLRRHDIEELQRAVKTCLEQFMQELHL